MFLGQATICCTLNKKRLEIAKVFCDFFFFNRIKVPYRLLCFLIIIEEPCSSEEGISFVLKACYCQLIRAGDTGDYPALASFFLGIENS